MSKRRADMTSMGGGDLRFPPTQWSQVLAARRSDASALEALLGRYWKPVYAYVRFEWSKDNETAKDLTQAFLLSLLEGGAFEAVAPEKGRFRDFLKVSLANFLRKAHRDAGRLKRGGGALRVPFDEVEAAAGPEADPARTAAEAFDRAWRSGVLQRGLEALRAELAAKGKQVRWEVFERLVLREGGEAATYAEEATRLGITVSDVTNHLHAARKRLRETLRGILLEGLSDPSDLDDEWSAVLGGSFRPTRGRAGGER